MITLNINGLDVSVEKGTTILEAARFLGFPIPTLCHMDGLTSYGACRLCVVEIGQEPKSKLVSSCTYPAEEGLKVRTASARVLKARKMILELLLASCPQSKIIQDLASAHGIRQQRFKQEYEDCILCGLCVRACKEIMGKSAISLVNRGIYKEVAAPFYAYEVGEECIGCGDCAYVCPTGAIQMGDDGKPVLPQVKIPFAELDSILSH